MMLSTLLYAALLLQAVEPPQQATPTPTTAPPLDWIVFVAAPVYQPDGGLSAETVALPDNGPGLVHLYSRRSICEPAVAVATEPKDAAFGWRIASQIVSRNERELVVSITWRRLWDAGRKIPDGPGSTVQLTLHPGARIPLDHIVNLKPQPDCRAVGLGLEVRVAQTAAATSRQAPPLPLGSTPGGVKALDAELWLLHTSPSDVQQVVHQTVRIPVEGGRFNFAPIAVNSARGTASVELSGYIDRYRDTTGAEFLMLSLTRRVKAKGLPAEGVPSSTAPTRMPLPSPTEVPQFDLPGAGRGRTLAGGVDAGAAGGGGARGGTGGGTVLSGAGATQGTARGGGGGGGRGGAISPATQAQVAALLEGQTLALRMRVTQVN